MKEVIQLFMFGCLLVHFWKGWGCFWTHDYSVSKTLALYNALHLFDQSWTDERRESVPESSVLLGEEADPVCSGETAATAEEESTSQ